GVAKVGSRCLSIYHPSASRSYSHQDFALKAGIPYRFGAWVAYNGIETTTGDGVYMETDIVAGGTTWLVSDRSGAINIGSQTATVVSAGVSCNPANDGVWRYVSWVVTPVADCTVRLYLSFGNGVGSLSGQAFFDGVTCTPQPVNSTIGGYRGSLALDSGGVAVSTAIDFTRPYVNKTVDYIGDGATNQLAGGARGYQALDSNYRVVGQTTLPMTRTGNVGSSQGGVNPITVSWNSGAGLWQANISSHSLYHGASSPTFYNSGSVLLPGFNTSYYIYTDDPTYVGGAVTYSVVASNSPSTIVGAEGRYFVGSATSGSSGGGGSGSGGGGGGTGGACFEGDTPVAMGDGSFRPIAAIREGDRVVSFDPSTGELGTKRVTGVMVHEVRSVIAIESDGGDVVTTPEHPFY